MLSQIIIQETTADQKRVLLQTITGPGPDGITQEIVNYTDLSVDEKDAYDAFVNLVSLRINE